MKSALPALEAKGITFTLNYLGKDDALTLYETAKIIENDSLFGEIIGNACPSITNIDDFFVFLFVRKISSFSEVIPLIAAKDNQMTVSHLVEEAKGKFSLYPKGDVVIFLNSNYQVIFSDERSDCGIKNCALQLIAQYQSSLSDELFMYLIQAMPEKIFANYDKFKNAVEGRPVVAAILFSEETVKKTMLFGFEDVLDVVRNVYNRKPDLVRVASDYLLQYGLEKANEINIENVSVLFHEVLAISKFSKDIRHPTAYQFIELENKVQKLLDQYLEKYGHKIIEEVPLEQVVNLLKAEDKPWANKLLALTHSPNEEKTALRCVLDQKPKQDFQLADLGASNTPTNSYFTYSCQNHIHMLLTVGGAASNLLLGNEDCFKATISTLLSVSEYIGKALNNKEEGLEDDINLLSQLLGNLFLNPTVIEEESIKPIAYGSEILLCSLIEKQLRLAFLSINQNGNYVPMKSITLGSLLQDDSNPLVDLFGEHMIKTLKYILTTDTEDVGYNIRNDLAHLSGAWKNRLGKATVCMLFYLYLCVTNSIFLYCSEKSGFQTKM